MSPLSGNISSFRFVSHDVELDRGKVSLRYAFDDQYEFTEELSFGPPQRPINADAICAVQSAIRALHIAAGVSYYKALAPRNLVIDGPPLDRESATFFGHLYSRGLAEFAYRNALSVVGQLEFPSSTTAAKSRIGVLGLPTRALVPIGGGKDSLAAVEVLRRSKIPVVLFGVNRSRPVLSCIEQSGLPSILAQRKIDSKLYELNAAGAYNGHVPVTAIISLMAVVAALLHGANAVVMSNERSANEGNLKVGGLEVNHQYSKSLEFEIALAEFVHTHIAADLDYFSLLRPLSEVHITRLFASETRYDNVFSSCNGNFRRDANPDESVWCLHCPKCRFVTIALAQSMPKPRALGILGGNMLADEEQIEGFRELVGLRGHKPWECVGELNESAAAVWHLSCGDSWNQDVVVRALASELESRRIELEDYYRRLFIPSMIHHVPQHYNEALNAALSRL